MCVQSTAYPIVHSRPAYPALLPPTDVTTAYVDHLHSYSSAPPSPSTTPSPSPSRSPSRTRRGRIPKPHRHSSHDNNDDTNSGFGVDISEQTPLLIASSTPPTTLPVEVVDADDAERVVAQAKTAAVPVVDLTSSHRSHSPNHQEQHDHLHDHDSHHSQGSSHTHTRLNSSKPEEDLDDAIFAGSHHRYETRGTHASHSVGKGVGRKIAAVVLYDEGEPDVEGASHVINAKRKCKVQKAIDGSSQRRHRSSHSHGHAHGHEHSHSQHRHGQRHEHGHGHGHGHAHLDMASWDPDVEAFSSEGDEYDSEEEEEVRVGRRRQIVGILVSGWFPLPPTRTDDP